MSKVNISKELQIKWILIEHLWGSDNQDQHMPSSFVSKKDFEFEDIFSIDENDVYHFVQKHSWDSRIVKYADKLPDPYKSGLFYGYIMLPKKENKFLLATFGSFERNLWDEWNFSTEEERDRFIIHRLFETQRGFWGKKPTPQEYGFVQPDVAGTAWPNGPPADAGPEYAKALAIEFAADAKKQKRIGMVIMFIGLGGIAIIWHSVFTKGIYWPKPSALFPFLACLGLSIYMYPLGKKESLMKYGSAQVPWKHIPKKQKLLLGIGFLLGVLHWALLSGKL
jgi:hypothetical protein